MIWGVSLVVAEAQAVHASILDGDSRGMHRGFTGNAPRLPPRFPDFSSRGVSSSDLDTVFFNNQSNTSLSISQRRHTRTPSCSLVMQEQPLWLDELLEDSEGSSKKGSHRRSSSDSFTYLENAGSLCMFSNIAEEDESECNSALPSEKVASLDNVDGDQLTDLLEEIQQLQDQQNLPISARTQPGSSKCESSNASKTGMVRASLEASPGHVCGLNAESLEDGDFYFHGMATAESTSFASLSEANLDPKHAKRVLANRQSAQRSRVRKLQYIAELERIVNALQRDLSSLSLQVLYLKHQRALLNMDNSALKQRIALFVQEKSIKDSQNETLMNDVRRLQKLSEIQVLHHQQKQKQQQLQHHHIQRHSSLPSDFGVQMHQYGELSFQQTKADASSPDSLTGLTKDFAAISLGAGSSSETLIEDGGGSNVSRTSLTFGCTIAGGGKSFEGNS